MNIHNKEEWIKKRKQQRLLTTGIIFGIAGILIIILLILLIQSIAAMFRKDDTGIQGDTTQSAVIGGSAHTEPSKEELEEKRDFLKGVIIEEKFLQPNEYSRPQIPLEEVTGIVVHYVGNPGTTAEANRNYFNNLAVTKEASSSSHYVIGLEGEIIQCIPLDEIAYATRQANYYTISIECCHPDSTGKFNKDTYQSLVKLTAWLCHQYDLEREDIIRHYDVTAKECPRYYVKNEEAWEQFRDDVIAYLNENIELGESL